jgi:hypothetical protein
MRLVVVIRRNINKLALIRKRDPCFDEKKNLTFTFEQFIKKAEQGLDQSLRFNVSQETSKWLPKGAAIRGFENVSDCLRFLIEQDRQQLK